jgi:hypothetical protein
MLSHPATKERVIREGIWPPDFVRYETLLEIGRETGRSVRFADVADSPLLHTIADLAKERPGIRVSELASLHNLDPPVAAKLARQVVSGCPCGCFVCQSTCAVIEPGAVSVTFDAE